MTRYSTRVDEGLCGSGRDLIIAGIMGISGYKERNQHRYERHENAFDLAMQLPCDEGTYHGQCNGEQDSGRQPAIHTFPIQAPYPVPALR